MRFLFISARALLAWLCQERYRAVAHAARGAQSRDDGGDDAADDLEDGLPRFLVLHGIKCFGLVTVVKRIQRRVTWREPFDV